MNKISAKEIEDESEILVNVDREWASLINRGKAALNFKYDSAD